MILTSASGGEQQTLLFDEAHHVSHAAQGFEVGHDVGACAAHALGVGFHHIQVCADVRGQVGFVDDEQDRKSTRLNSSRFC